MADAMAPTPGKFIWNELATSDSAGCAKFYCELFGWTATTTPNPHHQYTIFKLGDQQVGGMIQMTKEWGDARPHWMGYVAVADVDASAAKVKELGGSVCVPPTDIPNIGRFSVVQDPTGAVFSIMSMLPR
jgi:predicted enzyme related to lactoylglutathione lyase